jgi:CspA family cold shock protein
MAAGVLKWWNADRGFGFIATDSDRFFFHVGALKEAGIDPESLQVGQRLTFEIETMADGRTKAVDVRLLVRQPLHNRPGRRIPA